MHIGTKIYHFKELDSTNEFAKTLKDADEGTVVVADKQKQGKGRLGRNWYSPEEGLWFSIILKPKDKTLPLQMIIGVAVCDALKTLGIDANLKWPNDVIIGTKKIAGILAEVQSRLLSGRDDAMILGIGLNLNIQEFPKEIKETASSLFLETGQVFDKQEILELLFNKIEQKYRELEQGKIQELLNEWRNYSITLGKPVEIKTPTEILQGKAMDIDKNGVLLLELPSGSIRKIFAGECSIIKSCP